MSLDPEHPAPAEGGNPDEGSGFVERWRARGRRALDEVGERYEEAERRWPPLTMLRDVVERYRRAGASILAGHVAFRTFLWLVPFALLVTAITGFLSAAHLSTGGALSHLGISQSLGSSIDDAGQQASHSRFPAFVLALWGTAYTGNGLLKALHGTFALAWDLPIGRLERRASTLGKFLGGLVVALLGVGLAGAVARANAIVGLGSIVTMFGVFLVGLLGLSWILPRRATRPWDLLPGCAAGALGLVGLHVFDAWYLPSRIERASAVYGGLGVAIVTLGTLFIVSQLLIFTAILNASWFAFGEAGASWLPDLRRVVRRRSHQDDTNG